MDKIDQQHISYERFSMKKLLSGFLLVALVLMNFNGCATMIHTSQANVVSASGTPAPVRILENGMPVYVGNLPASFAVRSDRTYTVVYTATDGEERILTIAQEFNIWFIGSLLLGLFPAIVDLATGNVMQIQETTVVPISYLPQIILAENIPHHPELRIIGNIHN